MNELEILDNNDPAVLLKVGSKANHRGSIVTIDRDDGGVCVHVSYDGTGRRKQVPRAVLVPIDPLAFKEKQEKHKSHVVKTIDPDKEQLKLFMINIKSPCQVVKVANMFNIDMSVDPAKFGNAKMGLMSKLWSKIKNNEMLLCKFTDL